MPAGLRVSGPVKRTGARHQALAHWSLLQALRGPPQQMRPAVSRERSAAALRNLPESKPESMLARARRSVAATRSPPEVLTAQAAATQPHLTGPKPESRAALHCRALSVAALPVRSRVRMAQAAAAQWRLTEPKPRRVSQMEQPHRSCSQVASAREDLPAPECRCRGRE